jgi:hypothetical protein
MLTVPVNEIISNMAYAIGETPSSVAIDSNAVNRYLSCINRARWEVYAEIGLWSENYFNTFVTDSRVTDFSPTPDTTNLLPYTSALSSSVIAGGVALTPSFFHSYDNTFNLCKIDNAGTITFTVNNQPIGWYTFSYFSRSDTAQDITVTVSSATNSASETHSVGTLQRRKLSVFNNTSNGALTIVVTKSGTAELQFGDVQLESGVMATEYVRNTTASPLASTVKISTERIEYLSLYSPDINTFPPLVYGASPLPFAREGNLPSMGIGLAVRDNIISLQTVPSGTTFCYYGKSQPRAVTSVSETLRLETQDLALIISGATYFLTESTDAGEMSQRAAILETAFRQALQRRQTFFAPTRIRTMRTKWS